MPTPARLLPLVLITTLASPVLAQGRLTPAGADKLLSQLREATDRINKDHARSPGRVQEKQLAASLPRPLQRTLDALLTLPEGPQKWAALATEAQIAADLDRAEDLQRVEATLRAKAPEAARELGHYISRPRFLLHATGVTDELAEEVAVAFEGVLAAYDRTFGFREFSKVPGKKIRLELHREERPGAPHFAPEFPYHSTVDFPVGDEESFRSPTPDGRFLFYGLCHELGHLIAMWGDRNREEDHHAWAHFTGVVIVEACADEKWAKPFRDKQWRSLKAERKEQEETAPSTEDRAGVLRLLLDLHDLVGPARIGQALNLMEEKGMGHRINHVRYYSLEDLQKALLAGSRSRPEQARIRQLFQ